MQVTVQRERRGRREAASGHLHHQINDCDCDTTDQEAKDDGEHRYLNWPPSDLRHGGLRSLRQAREIFLFSRAPAVI
jgi:hypothetical protein